MSPFERHTGGTATFRGAALPAGLLIAGLTLVVAVPASMAAPGDRATAQVVDRDGESVGSVELEELQDGTRVVADLQNLPEGVHGFHIHEVGTCEAPFDSAEGHYNPTFANHGFDSQAGPHVGDLPNIHVVNSGRFTVEVFNSRLQISDTLFDDDGAAIMIHRDADDYASDPSGASGERIACGVLQR